VQGITGRIGGFHTKEMLEYGTNVVAGVTPGKGGTTEQGVPVFDTVKEAAEKTGATASIVFVPPPYAADSIMEAADAGLKLCVSITDGIPAQDMIKVKRYMRRYRQENRMRLVGPNCAGIISPGKALLGIMPGHIYLPGHVGIVGRSGTLGYEAASQMKDLGIGVSTSVGIGGDPINGSSFKDILELFEADPETHAVMMIGEIGGPQEAEAAEYIKERMTKPVVAYVAGLSAPKGRRMGHAGAIISAFGESASEKVEMLREVGVTIAASPSEIGTTVESVLKRAA
jgi:succinyl-CoA synthetase alpha subunit